MTIKLIKLGNSYDVYIGPYLLWPKLHLPLAVPAVHCGMAGKGRDLHRLPAGTTTPRNTEG